MQVTDVQFKMPLKRTAQRARAKLLSLSFITSGKKGEKHNSSGFPLFLIFFFVFAGEVSTVALNFRPWGRAEEVKKDMNIKCLIQESKVCNLPYIRL